MNFPAWLISTAYAQGLPGLNLQTGPLGSTEPGTGLAVLANRILDTLLAVAWPLAFIGILYSAYILISSAGKVEAYTTAKKNIGYLFIGITVIILGLYVIRGIIGIFGQNPHP